MSDTRTMDRKELFETLKWLEAEADVAEYCAAHKLDYSNSSDYARAVIATNKKESDTAVSTSSLHSNNRTPALHESNSVDSETMKCYTEISDEQIRKRIETLEDRFQAFSEYSWIGRIKNAVHSVRKALVPGCVVVNNTSQAIAVAGSPVENPDITVQAWIPRGRSTRGSLNDTDAVVIARGQKYLKPGTRDEIVTAGAIKVVDSYSVASVEESRKYAGVFYVDGSRSSYFPPWAAQGHGWYPRY